MTDLVRVENLHKSFGTLEVLKGIDLSVLKGETVVLLGSSGSGKSTLLRCINFMETPTSGRVYLNGKAVGTQTGSKMKYAEADLCKLRTRIGMVFQHFNLFPHMTVLQNVMEGQRTVLGRDKAEAEEKSIVQLTRVISFEITQTKILHKTDEVRIYYKIQYFIERRTNISFDAQ